jgi:hypothetical protein
VNKEQFIAELSKLNPSSTFLSVMGYRNAHAEIANYSIVFHMSYPNALKRSISILEEFKTSSPVEETARKELLNSFHHSLDSAIASPIEERVDGYRHFKDVDGNYIKGVKLHMKTGTLHLYGLLAQKRIIMPVSYPERHESALSKAKRQLQRQTPAGKFRQFKMLPSQVDHIAVLNLTLLPPDN